MIIDNEKIIISKRGDFLFFNISEVLYFERFGNWTILHTEDEEYHIRNSLKNIEKMATENDSPFSRVHKSFIINCKKINRLKSLNTQLYEVIYTDVKVALATKKKMKMVYKL